MISIFLVVSILFTSINWDAILIKAETVQQGNEMNQDISLDDSFNTLLEELSEEEFQEYEIEEERTENTTTYQLANGQKKVVFHGENVRFENEKKELVDYDASLTKIKEKVIVAGYGLDY